uniref:HTH_48 domain-containing protein n=1 Tax=Glossina austeni TaxID=7395 RepID=A0A1A9VF31_GLOAU
MKFKYGIANKLVHHTVCGIETTPGNTAIICLASHSRDLLPSEAAIKMRTDNHTRIRHIMLYCFEKGWKEAQSFHILNELFGEGTIGESRCAEWFGRLTSLVYKLRRRRPSVYGDLALLAAVGGNERLTTRMLADNFNFTTNLVYTQHLKEIYENGKYFLIVSYSPWWVNLDRY